jgi:hypothetical protein
MRTTLVLNDALVTEAKRVAADRGMNLSAVVNEALGKALHPAPTTDQGAAFSIPTFLPGPAKPTDSLPADLHELMAEEERAPYGK